MNWNQRLKTSSKVYKYSIAWAIAWAFLAAIALYAALHGHHSKHHPVDKDTLYAGIIFLVLSFLAYGVSKLAAGGVSHNASRAFDTVQFQQLGVSKKEAQRMANVKARHEGR